MSTFPHQSYHAPSHLILLPSLHLPLLQTHNKGLMFLLFLRLSFPVTGVLEGSEHCFPISSLSPLFDFSHMTFFFYVFLYCNVMDDLDTSLPLLHYIYSSNYCIIQISAFILLWHCNLARYQKISFIFVISLQCSFDKNYN